MLADSAFSAAPLYPVYAGLVSAMTCFDSAITCFGSALHPVCAGLVSAMTCFGSALYPVCAGLVSAMPCVGSAQYPQLGLGTAAFAGGL